MRQTYIHTDRQTDRQFHFFTSKNLSYNHNTIMLKYHNYTKPLDFELWETLKEVCQAFQHQNGKENDQNSFYS